jgi:LysM repeat protein
MATELIDYSFARPNLAQVKAAGVTGVIRYLTGSGKGLTTGEIQRIRAAGLSLTLVYETTGRTVKGGRSAGVADGQAALSALRTLGLPRSVVYFAVDYDLQPGEYGLLDAYLDGIASVLGKQCTGVYAGYGPCARAMSRGYAAWQTYAWSGGKIAPGIRIYQYRNGVTIGGGQVDRNRTSLADYGQVKWDSAAAAPMPAFNPSAASGSLEQLASAVLHGDYGNGDARKAKLGAKYTAVMAIVNERARVTSAKQSHETLANEAIAGRLGNGTERERLLGTYAKAVQAIINSKLGAPAKTAPAPAETYTVKTGDTLSGIAAAHHTTWQALAAKNHISNPNLIHPGQTITL